MYFVCPKILDVSPILAICNFNERATLHQAEIVKMGDDPTGGINLKCIQTFYYFLQFSYLI